MLKTRRIPHPLLVVVMVIAVGWLVGAHLSVNGTLRPLLCPAGDCRSMEIDTDVYGSEVRTKCYHCGRWFEWQRGVAVDVTPYAHRKSVLASQ